VTQVLCLRVTRYLHIFAILKAIAFFIIHKTCQAMVLQLYLPDARVLNY